MGEGEGLPRGQGLGSSTHLGTPFRFHLPGLHRVGGSPLGPAGRSWEPSQAATSLLGWQLLGRPQFISKPGLKIRFLMKDCGLGAKTFTGLDTWAHGRLQGHSDEQLVGIPLGELHSGQEADHKGNLPTRSRCHT